MAEPGCTAPGPGWLHVCASDAVVEKGPGVRFAVQSIYGDSTGFVVRYHDRVRAYLNRCAHVPVELDWEEGRFFDRSGLYLFCAMHGAVYEPESGRCAGGPCRGGRLRPIAVMEMHGAVYWQPDDFCRAAASDLASKVAGPISAASE